MHAAALVVGDTAVLQFVRREDKVDQNAIAGGGTRGD